MSRYIALLSVLLMLSGCAGGLRTYSPTSDSVQVMGRHLVLNDGSVDFGASGVTFFTRFRGTQIQVDLEDEFRNGEHNWFTVVVDGGTPVRFRTESGKRTYTLARNLKRGEHRVALSKATEGQNGHNRLVAIHTPRLLPADPLPSRKLEFIGNSITAGFGADAVPVACGSGTWYDATHAWLAYGPRVARSLGAQWMLSSVSGIGMLRNWNSPAPVMPDVYDDVYMEYGTTVPWDFKRYTPDLVVVALGTNDFSDGDGPTPRAALNGPAFVDAYTHFVEHVRGNYPQTRILLMNSPMLDATRQATLDDYLQEVISRRSDAGDTAVTRFNPARFFASGCDGHPDLKEQALMADALEAEIRKLMGW